MNFEKLNTLLAEFHKRLKNGEHCFSSSDGSGIYTIDFKDTNKAKLISHNSLFQEAPLQFKSYMLQKIVEMETIKHDLAIKAIKEVEANKPKIELVKPMGAVK